MNCDEDAEIYQHDLDMLAEWANEWQLQYNLNKCEVIHFGSKNKEADYYLNGYKLGEETVQRDLGIFVHQWLKVSMQVQQAIKK
eukprot:g10140.t1